MPKLSDLIPLYQRMSELTAPECKSSCRVPHSCCHEEYCGIAIEYSKEVWGVTLEPTGHKKLPLMGPDGCTAAPHLRPICTVHTCDVNSFGCKMRPAPDPKWNKEYFRLRHKIEAIEMRVVDPTRRM